MGHRLVADLTGSLAVNALYYASLFALWGLVYSFITQFDLKVFRHFTDRTFAAALDLLLTIVISTVVMLAVVALIGHVAAQVADANAR